MTDYIRKAVELVGWLEHDDEGEYLQIPDQPFSSYLDEITAPCKQYLLDALAAQLVRQARAQDCAVCAANSPITGNSCIVTNWRAPDGEDMQFFAQGDDITMNTIRAIVDSGVLIVDSGVLDD